jgi:myosin-3
MSVESKTNKILGAKITNYLLEKSRLISKGPNERNFHILYMMITQ